MTSGSGQFQPKTRAKGSSLEHDRENLLVSFKRLQVAEARMAREIDYEALIIDFSDEALATEALVIRANTFISRLPQNLQEQLDPEDIKGLRGTRNVIAHDFFP